MKKLYIRIASLILSGAIIFSLAACSGSKDADTTAPETEKQDFTKELKEKFEKSAEKMNAFSSLDLDVTVDTKRKVGTDEYSEFSEQHFDLAGINTEEFAAAISDKTVLDGTVITTKETFGDCKAFCEYETGDIFFCEMTGENFRSRRIPTVIIDPAIYGKISASEKDEGTLIFENAEKLEEWIAPEYATLIDAVATAKIDESGFIEKMEYTCTYTQGNADITTTYTVKPVADENTAPQLPEEEGCTQLDNIDAVAYFLFAKDRITSTAAIIAGETREMAATVPEGLLGAMSINESYAIYEKDSALAAKTDGAMTVQQYDGNTSYEWTETFKDGKSYMSENGSEEKENTATFADYEANVENTILGYIPTSYDLTSVSVSSLTGEFILIEYTLDNSCPDGESYGKYVCEMLYGDEDFLMAKSTEYVTNKISGYIAFDLDAMIPTSVSVEFSGSYAVDSNTVTVALVQKMSLDIANDRSYTEATGEYLPEEEPEKKAEPLLYTVTSPEGKMMYLFGTIHIGDERTAYLPDEIYSALDESDVLALEINTETFEDKIMADSELISLLQKSYYYLDGTTLKDHVPEDLYNAAIEALKVSGAYTLYSEVTRPSILCSSYDYFLMNTSKDISDHKGIEQRFLKYIKDKDIVVEDIETPEGRLNMDIRYSEKTQEMLLSNSVSCARIAAIDQSRELFELWCEGDEKKLIEYIRDDDEYPENITEEEKTAAEEYNNIMVTERDRIMIDKAKEYLSVDRTVFFAVGLAHLLGETGLVDALREAGYTVELVEYK